jgi:hypothetical protein
MLFNFSCFPYINSKILQIHGQHFNPRETSATALLICTLRGRHRVRQYSVLLIVNILYCNDMRFHLS